MAKTPPPSFATAPTPAPAPATAPTFSTVVPAYSTGREASVPVSRIPPAPPFVLTHHPEAWTVCDGGKRVLPMLSKMPFYAGANGILPRKGGGFNTSEFKTNLEVQGLTPIPYSAVPPHHIPAGMAPSYMVTPAGRPDAHILLYTKVFPGSDATEQDWDGYQEFCDYLIAKGHIRPPQPYVLRKLLAAHERCLTAATDRAKFTSRALREVELHERCIASIKAKLVEVEQTPAAVESPAITEF